MKLNYYINSEGKKEYTLKEENSGQNKQIKPAHYKYIKIRDAPKSDIKFFKKK